MSKQPVCPKSDTGGEVKKWEKYHKIGHFSLLSGEYQPPLVLEKNRTSLRKSTSPPVSHLGLTARLLPKRRGTHKKASLPKPPERLVLEGNFSEQTLCHSKQATCMPPKWP